eukprot:Phypoly_transcript_09126.p1 GENE.Phypoly_transcript_09126~~Phypoly_transcript_09126.p1  ORF type:complete len:144 (+),score=30.40 Phypoly_transcript_09126:1002-1433(+)
METTGNQNSSTCAGIDSENNSVRWFTISYNKTTLYGQFLNYALLDGHVRNITYTSSSPSIVTAVVQHFWESAEVDPNFVVLLDNEDPCTHKKGFNKKLLLAILIPVVVVVLLLILFIGFYSRISTWVKLRQAKNSHVEMQNVH